MAENPFRILLDFRELNFKFYKFVWMSISPRELVTVKDLKEAIFKKFSFERTDFQLFLRDGLLPEDENISNILRENDTVRLFHGESSISNQSESKILNCEYNETSTNDDQETSSKKRKTQSDTSVYLEEDIEQENCNKKRKHSFSNGTYLFDSDSTPATSASINAVTDNIENVSTSKLYNFETQHQKPYKIKKKLKFTNDASQLSAVTENETFLSSCISPRSEKNESRVNSCKKKKKHKHSKDRSENDILFQSDIDTVLEANENESSSRKKKNKSHYSTAVSLSNEILGITEELNDSANGVEESHFETVTEDSEVLKLAPNSFCTSSVNNSSGIGSLKSSEETKRNVSSEKNCSESYNFDGDNISELEPNNQSVQGNNCKKKKRKRHRKRKSLLIQPEVDMSNDWNLDTSTQRMENLNSSSTTISHQVAESAPRIKETAAETFKFNTYVSKGTKKCSKTNNFLEQFKGFLPNTSTPFSQTSVMSLRNNAISKFPTSPNVSQDQSCTVTSQNASEKKMNENYLSSSLPSNVVMNKNKVTFPSHNFLEKSLSKKSCSSEKSTDSFSNVDMKSRFLGPTFSYEGCPPLNSCPVVGMHIAYKVLELDETYSPVVSNYKEGHVKAVNSQTDELEIELVEPEVKQGRTGKFENLYEDELPPPETIKKVTLSWPSLINPVQVPN